MLLFVTSYLFVGSIVSTIFRVQFDMSFKDTMFSLVCWPIFLFVQMIEDDNA